MEKKSINVILGNNYSDKYNIGDEFTRLYMGEANIIGFLQKQTKFEFNKDAGMYQCKAGHLAIHKYLDKRQKEKKNKKLRMVYFFDVEKCKCCPYREGCYKKGGKNKRAHYIK